MRRRILITILLVTTFAVLAFFVPAALAVRSGIQRSDLLELQREASIVATRLRAAGADRSASTTSLERGHDFGVYDADGARQSTAAARRSPTEPVRQALTALPDEGYVGDDLVAAAPLHSGAEVVGAVRVSEPGSESDGRVRRSVLLLGLAGIAIIAVAGVDRCPPRPTPQPAGRAAAQVGVDDRSRRRRTAAARRASASSTSSARRSPTPATASASCCAASGRSRRTCRTSCARRWRRCASRSRPSSTRRAPTAPWCCTRASARSTAWSRRSRACWRWPATTSARRRGATSARSCASTPSAGGRATRGRPGHHRARRHPARRGRRRGGRAHPRRAARQRPRPRPRPGRRERPPHAGRRSRSTSATRAVEPRADPFSEERADTGHGIGLRLARTLAESEAASWPARGRHRRRSGCRCPSRPDRRRAVHLAHTCP